MSMYLNAAETVFSVASVTSVTSDRTVCFVLGFCVCLILTHPHLQQLRYNNNNNNNDNNNNNNTPAAAEVSSMARQLPRHSHCSVSVLQAAGHS